MSIEGNFITLIVADTFLCNDYEYSLKISQLDFSYVANMSLFEGNILRFRALASIRLFEFAQNEEGDLVENFSLIKQAIDSLRDALKIYQAQDVPNESN